MRNILMIIKQDVLNWYKGVVAVIIYCVVMDFFFGKVCPMVLLTGFPCPACGLTRAGIALLTFHWEDAWQLNAVIYLIAVFGLYFVLCRYFLQCKCYGWIGLILVIAACLFGLYGYRMINDFPSQAPMEYYEHNLVQRILIN